MLCYDVILNIAGRSKTKRVVRLLSTCKSYYKFMNDEEFWVSYVKQSISEIDGFDIDELYELSLSTLKMISFHITRYNKIHLYIYLNIHKISFNKDILYEHAYVDPDSSQKSYHRDEYICNNKLTLCSLSDLTSEEGLKTISLIRGLTRHSKGVTRGIPCKTIISHLMKIQYEGKRLRGFLVEDPLDLLEICCVPDIAVIRYILKGRYKFCSSEDKAKIASDLIERYDMSRLHTLSYFNIQYILDNIEDIGMSSKTFGRILYHRKIYYLFNLNLIPVGTYRDFFGNLNIFESLNNDPKLKLNILKRLVELFIYRDTDQLKLLNFLRDNSILSGIKYIKDELCGIDYIDEYMSIEHLNNEVEDVLIEEMDKCKDIASIFLINMYSCEELIQYSKHNSIPNYASVKPIIPIEKLIVMFKYFNFPFEKCDKNIILDSITLASVNKDQRILELLEYKLETRCFEAIFRYYPELFLEMDDTVYFKNIAKCRYKSTNYSMRITSMIKDSAGLSVVERYSRTSKEVFEASDIIKLRCNKGLEEWYILIPHVREYSIELLNLCIYDRVYKYIEDILSEIEPDYQSLYIADEQIREILTRHMKE